jgi:predicted component of type VI protein secretion system
MSSRAVLLLGGALAGLAVGWGVAQRRLDRHRADLFSPVERRRSDALAYLAGERSPAAARVLRDYLVWESDPGLRRRAGALLRRLELSLG